MIVSMKCMQKFRNANVFFETKVSYQDFMTKVPRRALVIRVLVKIISLTGDSIPPPPYNTTTTKPLV